MKFNQDSHSPIAAQLEEKMTGKHGRLAVNMMVPNKQLDNLVQMVYSEG